MIEKVFVILALTSTVIYMLFAIRALFGLMQVKISLNNKIENRPLSIIVPFRNEVKRLPVLLESLKTALKHTDQKVQIILVDDHSDDGFKTSDLAFEMHSLDQTEGKKAAIDLGINCADHEFILTLDADSEIEPDFFKVLSNKWTDEELFILPVVGKGNPILKAESHAICALTLGAVLSGKALLCNGAALGFRKSVLDEITIKNKQMASGDDMFLLEALKKAKKTIGGGLHPSLIVRTHLPLTFKTLTYQRVRWAAKGARSSDPDLILLGLSTMLMYLCFLSSFFILEKQAIGIILALFGLKLIIDYLLLFLFHIKTGLNAKWWAYPILGIAYPFYSLYIGLMSILIKPKWKGRQI